MISTRIPYTLPQGHEDNDVPTFWLLLQAYHHAELKYPLHKEALLLEATV